MTLRGVFMKAEERDIQARKDARCVARMAAEIRLRKRETGNPVSYKEAVDDAWAILIFAQERR